ncbi:MAG: hypothetical protein AAF683_00080 [Pseudomonadota bacterium]
MNPRTKCSMSTGTKIYPLTVPDLTRKPDLILDMRLRMQALWRALRPSYEHLTGGDLVAFFTVDNLLSNFNAIGNAREFALKTPYSLDWLLLGRIELQHPDKSLEETFTQLLKLHANDRLKYADPGKLIFFELTYPETARSRIRVLIELAELVAKKKSVDLPEALWTSKALRTRCINGTSEMPLEALAKLTAFTGLSPDWVLEAGALRFGTDADIDLITVLINRMVNRATKRLERERTRRVDSNPWPATSNNDDAPRKSSRTHTKAHACIVDHDEEAKRIRICLGNAHHYAKPTELSSTPPHTEHHGAQA